MPDVLTMSSKARQALIVIVRIKHHRVKDREGAGAAQQTAPLPEHRERGGIRLKKGQLSARYP